MIESASVTTEQIPFAEPFPTSYGNHNATQHVFVRLQTDSQTAYGEGTALRMFTGETTSSMEHLVRETLLPVVVGRSSDEALRAFRERSRAIPGNPGAKVSVEMALYDLKGKEAGLPVHALLGVRHRTEVPVVFAAGALAADVVSGRVESAFDAGFRTFKIKASGKPQDVERINAVTGVLAERVSSEDVFVRVDANTGWESFEQARRFIDRIDRHEFIEYFEQPVVSTAVDDLRSLRTTAGVPVFADESVEGIADARSLLHDPAAVSGLCVKFAKTGSLLDATVIGSVAHSVHVPITLVSAFETSLGTAANLHVAATLPRMSSAAELGGGLIETDPVDDPFDDGPTLSVPDKPGLGVALDETVPEWSVVR